MGSLLLRKIGNLRRFVRFSGPATAIAPAASGAAQDSATPKSSPPLPRFSSPFHPSVFSYSSSSYFPRRFFSSRRPNVVVVNSEDQLNTAFAKAQDDALPSVFFFNAIWCGPCRLLYPLIENSSKEYPHVTFFMIDIDEDDIGSALKKLNISSVPTLHFYHNGKKEAEMFAADVTLYWNNLQELYSD